MIIICSFINYKFAIIGTFGSPFCMPSAIFNNVCDYFYFFFGQIINFIFIYTSNCSTYTFNNRLLCLLFFTKNIFINLRHI